MFPGIFFLLGATIVAYCVVGSRRMYYLGTGIAASGRQPALAFCRQARLISCHLVRHMGGRRLEQRSGLWWAARRQRSEYGGN